MLQTKMGMKHLDADSSSLIVNIGMTKMLLYVKADATAKAEATIIFRLPILTVSHFCHSSNFSSCLLFLKRSFLFWFCNTKKQNTLK